ncbi:MAG TPA: histidine kinase [Holophagaceae bacterium]|nr:histidine kinase [Holophagaceae bacterium]
MTTSRLLPLSTLALRLAAAAYLGQVTVALALAGPGAALIGGLVLFPGSALVLALLGTRRQAQSVAAGQPLTVPLTVSVQAPWTREEAAAEVEALLREDLGATALHRAGDSLRATFEPGPWAGRLRRWAGSDEATVTLPTEAGGALEATFGPRSAFLYQVLWVDGGRNARRLARFQQALAGRLAAAQDAARSAQASDAQAARLAQAELRLLRAQVEPHHLFNTLAHLRELVRTGDATAATAMVDALVDHLRQASTQQTRLSHPLAEEAATLRSYAALLALRFGDRLRVDVDLPEDLLALDVPVGTLLVPVENAVKHGLEPKAGGGTITVRGRREGAALRLEVRDDGVGLPNLPGSGTGLSNLRQRLKLAFGEGARLALEDADPGVRVSLDLPLPH